MQMVGKFEVMQEYQLKNGYLIGEALVVNDFKERLLVLNMD
jgi:hypothetical protein